MATKRYQASSTITGFTIPHALYKEDLSFTLTDAVRARIGIPSSKYSNQVRVLNSSSDCVPTFRARQDNTGNNGSSTSLVLRNVWVVCSL